MSKFVINGGRKLEGKIKVGGAKNAALPMIAAAILTKEEVVLSNVPNIRDVRNISEIMKAMGAEVEFSDNSLKICCEKIDPAQVPEELVKLLRGSILLVGPLLAINKKVRLPLPGGDVIGARPIEAHVDAFRQLGAKVEEGDDYIEIDGINLKPGRVILNEFSVTATENVLMLAAGLPGKTTIEIAAAEPHVRVLTEMLAGMGAQIEGVGTHTVTVVGKEGLGGGQFKVCQDILEAGLFILTAAATGSDLLVEGVPTDDMSLFFKKIKEIGVEFEADEEKRGVRVRPSSLKGFKVQTLPYPGMPTDLQAPFSVVATQAKGSSLIHDPMYEDRFRHVAVLIIMGAVAVVCVPHRVIIEGPTQLMGREIPSLDIRSGATLVLAGLVAEGQTIINEAEIIERGYEDLHKRLQSIGADIKLVD
jgi:UDP-N-acetylglucosamine 1-carboxyvinyltransferase